MTPRKTTPPKPPAKRAPRKAPKSTDPGEPAKPSRKSSVDVDEGTGARVLTFSRPTRSAGEKRVSTGTKTSPKAAQIATRRAEALTLRRNGASFVQIAEILSAQYKLTGYTNKTAWDDVRESIQRVRIESTQEYIEESVSRLDFALMTIAAAVADGNLDAIATMLKIEKRRADLLGLDAARRIQLTGADGGPIQFALPSIENPQEAYDAALRAVNETLGPPRELPSG